MQYLDDHDALLFCGDNRLINCRRDFQDRYLLKTGFQTRSTEFSSDDALINTGIECTRSEVFCKFIHYIEICNITRIRHHENFGGAVF